MIFGVAWPQMNANHIANITRGQSSFQFPTLPPRRQDFTSANSTGTPRHPAMSMAIRLVLEFLAVGVLSTAQAQTGAYAQNGGTATLSNFSTNTSVNDQSGIFAYNTGSVTVGTVNITTSGNASSADNAGKYGVNAGILAGTSTSKGTVVITGSSNLIVTSGSVANGLFATYSGSAITMLGGRISCTGANAHGVDVTYGGLITLSNVDIATWGASSSAIATDFGGGTLKVYGGTIIASNTTPGSHSAGIYSTGTISVNAADIRSMADCGGVIDGANTIILTNTVLQGALEGIKLWKTAPVSGNAIVTIKGGSLIAMGGNAFYVTGTTGNAAAGTINVLDGATLSASTGILVKADGSSTATFSATGVALAGNLVTDTTSTIHTVLRTNSTLDGAISPAGTGTENLTLDSTSTWNVTANSVLTRLTNAGTINGPGTVTAGTLILQSGVINAVLAGAAGLTKTTTGTATLSGANTYAGATTISNGILSVNGSLAGTTVTAWGGTLGGTGSLAGSVSIRSGATLAPGIDGVGTLTVSNTLTLAGGSTVTMEINKAAHSHDAIRVTGLLTMAGSLNVTNLSGTFTAGDSFPLFEAASYSGGFSSVTLPTLTGGLAWDTNSLTTNGMIGIVSIAPVFNAPVLSGADLVLSGTIPTTQATYCVLSTTNVTLPAAQWTPTATKPFQAGQFRFTNTIDPAEPQKFYRLRVP
jgi:autotransporter-associated beta strand protein